MPDKYLRTIPKTQAKKGDRVYYKDEFGYYIAKKKVHATFDKTTTTPFGSRKGQKMVWIWNPNRHGGGSNDANVFVPISKVKNVKRGFQYKKKHRR